MSDESAGASNKVADTKYMLRQLEESSKMSDKSAVVSANPRTQRICNFGLVTHIASSFAMLKAHLVHCLNCVKIWLKNIEAIQKYNH